jgi:hypothetical protein
VGKREPNKNQTTMNTLPQEKAKELIDKFYDGIYDKHNTWEQAKACASICVDEMINAFMVAKVLNVDEVRFLKDVKTEINNL